MGKIKISILEEVEYVSGFAAYVGQHRENWMELRCFTDAFNLKKHLTAGQIDVLLIGEKYICEFKSLEQIKKVIVLSESGYVSKEADYAAVFKYQSAEKLLKDVCGEIASGEGFLTASSGAGLCDKEFIGMFSPWGGCSSTLYAQKFCKKERTKKGVLYVNLHLLSPMLVNEKEKGHAGKKKFGMSELIYYIRQGKENAALKLRSIIREYRGIESIYPVEDYRDLYGMEIGDAKRLFEMLSQESMHDVIVLDIGFLSGISLLFLQLCDNVYLPEATCEAEQSCMKSFKELLLKEGLDELEAKCITVRMEDGGDN